MKKYRKGEKKRKRKKLDINIENTQGPKEVKNNTLIYQNEGSTIITEILEKIEPSTKFENNGILRLFLLFHYIWKNFYAYRATLSQISKRELSTAILKYTL